MDSLLLVCVAGLAAGTAHVYLGVDHLAALMPLSQGGRAQAISAGIKWGLGHSLGVILVALSFLAFRDFAALQLGLGYMSEIGEHLVGVMLIGIGAFGIRTALKQHVHSHHHEHDSDGHAHIHAHLHADQAGLAHETVEAHQHGRFHAHTAIFAGMLQGIAGMSYLWGVLPSLALPMSAALAYLAAFAAGSIAAMALFSAMFGELSSRFEAILPNFIRTARLTVCGLCATTGAVWLALSLTSQA